MGLSILKMKWNETKCYIKNECKINSILFYLTKKASSEITTLQNDYITSDNVHLFKGQHVQVLQRLNNDLCLVQLLNCNNLELSSSSSANTNTNTNINTNNNTSSCSNSKQQQQHVIEVQIPTSLIKSRHRNNYDGNFS